MNAGLMAGAAWIAVGAGLIGMTAAELPGIPSTYGIPPWLMGLVGGAIVGWGLRVAGWRPAQRNAAVAVATALAGTLFAIGNHVVLPAALATVVNTLGRASFLIGLGVLLGYALRAWARRQRQRRTGLPLDG